MNNNKEVVTFTLRIPKELCDEIDNKVRKKYYKSRNAYIIQILLKSLNEKED